MQEEEYVVDSDSEAGEDEEQVEEGDEVESEDAAERRKVADALDAIDRECAQTPAQIKVVTLTCL